MWKAIARRAVALLVEKEEGNRAVKKWIIFLWIIFNSIPLMNPVLPLALEKEEDLEVTVKGVDLNPFGESSVVVLVDLKGEMALPILIGFSEARAISLKINNIVTIRPMTHDLMNNIFDHVKVKLVRAVINKVEGDIIYSILYFTLDDSEVQVDSRPSDAIALALRAEAPIFVAKEVFNAVGVKLGESGQEPRFTMRQGLTVQQMTPLLAKYFGLESSEGVLVSDVKPGSPAEGAGLKTGDVIIEVNGQRIKSVRGIKSIVKEIGEGERITLLIRRGADSIPLVIHP